MVICAFEPGGAESVAGSIPYRGGAQVWRSQLSHQWLISCRPRSFGGSNASNYSRQLSMTSLLSFGNSRRIKQRPLRRKQRANQQHQHGAADGRERDAEPDEDCADAGFHFVSQQISATVIQPLAPIIASTTFQSRKRRFCSASVGCRSGAWSCLSSVGFTRFLSQRTPVRLLVVSANEAPFDLFMLANVVTGYPVKARTKHVLFLQVLARRTVMFASCRNVVFSRHLAL